MDSDSSNENRHAGVHRWLPALTPVLLVSTGYIDPGKWAVTVEGAVRFGYPIVAFLFVFNCAAVLCQSLSAHIAMVTGKNLAEIYKDEYDQCLCFLLGVQAEVSTIASDIAMVLGIAHGLNLLLGLDLFSCFFLTALEAILYSFSANFLESCKDKFHWLRIGCVVLFASAFGVLLSQAEISASLNGLPTKFSGEGAYVLMGLLGAGILPQNIYLHSVLVQKQKQIQTNMRSPLYNDHLFATICVFSGIFLASYILAISVVNASINDPSLVLLTFQDAMLLIEQLLRSPIAAFAYLLVLIGTSQITSLIWNIGGEPVLHNFLRLDIPSWVHRAGIRMVSILSATYFLQNSGVEGLYQLLILMQVIVALLLPSSLIPLFRVATSTTLMGGHRISQFVEFVALIILISMLGMKIVFVEEMIFGSSDWAGNFLWNIGSGSSSPYVILLTTACASIGLMLWLATTPLRSASSPINSQEWNWDTQMTTPGYNRGRELSSLDESGPVGEERIEKLDSSTESNYSGKILVTSAVTYASDTPEVESQPIRHWTAVEDRQSAATSPSPQVGPHEEKPAGAESVSESPAGESTDGISSEVKVKKINVIETVEKIVEVENGERPEKGNYEISFGSEEIPRTISGSTLEAPGSLKSLNGKGDDSETATGSLSRLAGLGRAAKRQLAVTLDEFWGQLFNFHGQVTQEAKLKKFDVILGIESKSVSSVQKVEASGLDASSYFPNLGGAGSDPLVGSGLFETLEHQRMQTALDFPYRMASGSLSSQQLRLLRACEQVSSEGFPDGGERRYSSLRLPPRSEGFNDQPATVHGYQLAPYLNRIGNERSSDLNRQSGSPVQKSLSSGPLNYKDSNAFSLGQKLQNAASFKQSSLQQTFSSRNNLMQPEMPYYESFSQASSAGVISPINEKKYRSLPDISGASLLHHNVSNPGRNAQWDNGIRYGLSLNKPSYEPSPFSSSGMIDSPLSFDEIFPSESYRNALSFQLTTNVDSTSLWSKQPFEQFGLDDRSWTTTRGFESNPNMTAMPVEIPDLVDPEVMLLQSLRQCILKLLKLEGSDWLFKQNTGVDEELIDRVAAREKVLNEAENREMTHRPHVADVQYPPSDRRSIFSVKSNEAGTGIFSVSTVPHCGDDCIWKAELIISFGVWCIHRILDLSLMESRPELWGKYTYVLNRLQGVIDPAFSKPRSPAAFCFCLQISGANALPTSFPVLGNGGTLPPPAKLSQGKCTTAAMLLDTIKDVEVAISGRKGRTGTAAGDVAFPNGKKNLASVLKRYKRRLSKLPNTREVTSNTWQGQPAGSYGS
ncbi:hypothetical protein MLD38_026608 [Melastoma candidum]|uniref:Uncharacterized protein n=1 Tax=Melastoma candidum TaxID=119954 RepID=A0ACB9NYZ7_9MYRT|nr:hypothetical protein MLD38_026608 [Melastoma candidum]